MSVIEKIRTIRLKEYPNITWVELETKEGLTGLDEVWRGAAAVEATIHEEVAPWLLGQDSRQIERISHTLLTPYVGFHSSGSETRAASAVDIALWDLFGKRHGIPVYEALGGASREEVRLYNTCSGYTYNASSASFFSSAGRRQIGAEDRMKGPYDDQVAFTHDAGTLAKSLLSEGFSAMKIWPFDSFALKSGGTYISDEELEIGIEPFHKIREAVGNKIDIMCELHSNWNVPSAVRICRALERYDVFWAEDALCKMDDVDALKHLRRKTQIPLCGSETLAGTVIFRQMLNAGVFDYSMLDLGWCGGLTEGRKIADIAASYNVPVAPHDCTGPILLWAGLHLAFHSGNAVFMEVVRANLSTWYQDLVDRLPVVRDGMAERPVHSGLGASLRPETKQRPDAIIRESCL